MDNTDIILATASAIAIALCCIGCVGFAVFQERRRRQRVMKASASDQNLMNLAGEV